MSLNGACFFSVKDEKSASIVPGALSRGQAKPFDRIVEMRTALFGLASLLCMSVCLRAKPLEIFFVDVEGGQSTLFVTPAGESLLIDTGWPGNAFRDANRIVAACKLA